MALTLYEKIFNRHVVREDNDTYLIYIDRHLVHEVTSPQAFEGLRMADRKIWRTNSILAVPDHNVPTTDREKGILDPISKIQIDTLDENCKKNKLTQFQMDDVRQGIVHVIGPEQGSTLPGMTIVCGDSHTSTHGAFGALAVGIGTSEVEHVLATQCLILKKFKTMLINVNGTLGDHVSAKDIALHIIGQIGTAGGTGHAIEFAGSAIKNLSMEGRMTLCNMAIEAGAKVGLVAPDSTTSDYVKEHSFLDENHLKLAQKHWNSLSSDENAVFDKEVVIDVSIIKPQVTWGTSPEMVVDYDAALPEPSSGLLANKKNIELAKQYMGIEEGQKLTDLKFDRVFIGSCTNSRIEDLREAASAIKGKKVSQSITEAIVVPGSGMVKAQAEAEGLDKVFEEAGFIWRDPGCSMCLGMNPDQLKPYERCASTSNRNFEGRQGNLGRTHLMSPIMAAHTAIKGVIGDLS